MNLRMLPIRRNFRPILKLGISPQILTPHALNIRSKTRPRDVKGDVGDPEHDFDSLPNLTLPPGIAKPEIRYFDRTIDRSNSGGEHDATLQDAAAEKKMAALKIRIDQLNSEINELSSTGDADTDEQLAQLRRQIERDYAVDLKSQTGEAVDEEHEALLDRARPPGRRRAGRSTRQSVSGLKTLKAVRPDSPLSGKQVLYYERFQRAARIVASGHSQVDRYGELWKWYQLCKQVVPTFLEMLTSAIWASLWTPYIKHQAAVADTKNRVVVLGKDMQSIGKELNGGQLTCYVEALFAQGGPAQAKAISTWTEGAQRIGPEDPANRGFWSLGTLIHAASGELIKAEEIAIQYLNAGTEQDPRILTPLVYACAESRLQEDGRRAMDIYLLLKEGVGGSLHPAEYESISTSFLNGKHHEFALAVFRDLMYSIDPRFRESQRSQIAPDGRTAHLVRRIRQHLDRSGAQEEGLGQTLALPRTYQTKYFFASWLKQLIASGNLEETGAVIELMADRNIRPDARHLNGLIGAWLRKGDSASQKKAEELAWSMIQRRKEFVSRRRDPLPRANDPQALKISTPKSRKLPAASIETFGILAQHYLRKGKLDQVGELNETLFECELSPNTYFMNHVLSALQRSGNIDAAWTYYEGMIKAGMQPDTTTYVVLWRCTKLIGTRPRAFPNPTLPPPRAIFAEMLERLPGRKLELTEEDYRLVLQCFSLSLDCAGSLLALHALRDIARLYPGEKASRIVVVQLMKIAEPDKPLNRAGLRDNYEAVLKQMRKVGEERDQVFKTGVREVQEEDAEVRKGEENLWLLSELLRAALTRQEGSEAEARRHCLSVAEEMGLGPMDVFDDRN